MHDANDHPASYYAATANLKTDYPPLEGEHKCDVAVVGAGFTGLSAALRLAERGVDVAVVEANRVGWGASGRNGGHMIDGIVESSKLDEIERKFGRIAAHVVYQAGLDCRDAVLDCIAKYSIDCDLRLGYLDVALNRADLEDFEAEVARKKAAGYPHEIELVARENMHRFVGSKRYVGGLVNRGNGHLHPLNLCLGEARAAHEQGATIFEQSPVTRVIHGARPEVRTERGSLRANKVVLAGNAYLGRSEPRLYGKVIPAGSYMIATEPLAADLARELLPQDMAVCDQRVALNYFRLSADRRMVFGGLCNYSGRDPKDITAAIRPNMLKVFPQLADTRIEYEWGGYIAIAIRRIPQFGRIEGNTWYAQGYSGHGVAPAHIAGQILADAIGGDLARFEVFEKIRHWKLPGGKWFANPALALGMLYYRLKEIL